MIKTKFSLEKSKNLTFLLIFMHFGAMLCLFLLPFYFFIKIFGLIICLISLWQALLQYAWLKKPQSIRRFWLNEDGTWSLQKQNKEIMLVSLRKDSIVTTVFILLNFKSRTRKTIISIPIFADALSTGKMRRLRILLLTNVKISQVTKQIDS